MFNINLFVLGERPFQCSVCQRAFTSKRLLVDHSRLHTSSKPFWCRHCNQGKFINTDEIDQTCIIALQIDVLYYWLTNHRIIFFQLFHLQQG